MAGHAETARQARIRLTACPKTYTRDLDKAASPAETIARVRKRLASLGLDILAEIRRVDMGRLGIPVYMSVCGADARRVIPARKQMGKGSSPEQAEASALMELMERYAFFSFWRRRPHISRFTWSEAEANFGDKLLPLAAMSQSVEENGLDPDLARRVLDLVSWNFYPATVLPDEQISWLPLDWFKLLGEFNGASAGNTPEESLLQGLGELVERHVCCLAARRREPLPTISGYGGDEVLAELGQSFERNGVRLILKDFSLGLPLPTVAALAWDPSTFPESSEIVFAAGTASTPAKAAIRAVTEAAQLAGDFCSGSCYEASGLPKFANLEEAAWLMPGPAVSLAQLPDIGKDDFYEELLAAANALAPLKVYAVDTTHPQIGIPTHYSLIPGLHFRERDRNQSLGLFVGRKLIEDGTEEEIAAGLKILAECYPKAHFLPFFQGMLDVRGRRFDLARENFLQALAVQPEEEAAAMSAFYAGYASTLMEDWPGALPQLAQALELCPEMKEYASFLGVAHFKTGDYAKAARAFTAALKIDKGSAVDWANLGLCRKFMGEKNEAIHLLRTALELDPGLGFAHEQLLELEN
ncbi:MAG: YcaO-like family protein [Desulfovibrionaceae bacterium]|nr:YcaO-like family protein [Desulfovibrionaceae bacterium]